jgi:hypothetical protein
VKLLHITLTLLILSLYHIKTAHFHLQPLQEKIDCHTCYTQKSLHEAPLQSTILLFYSEVFTHTQESQKTSISKPKANTPPPVITKAFNKPRINYYALFEPIGYDTHAPPLPFLSIHN